MIEPPDQAELEPRLIRGVRSVLSWSEEALYITVGLLLLAAAVLVLVGTISGLIDSIRTHQGAVNIGVVLLDRILLTLIVVVRRILIITAELERQAPGGRALTNQLLELGLLGVLTLALAIAIYLVRRSSPGGYDPARPRAIEPPTNSPM